jgi:hypothetical protein
MFASRTLQHHAAPDGGLMSEFRLPILINRSFEGIMDAERLFIRLGARFPVGGSLLLIALKT